MTAIPFTKMDGLGNDFVIIDNRSGDVRLSEDQIVALGNRKTGVGFDQLIVLEKSNKVAVKILFFNADGSKAGACGNGSRCTGKLLMDQIRSNFIQMEAPDGRILTASRETEDGLVTVNMGSPRLLWNEIPLAKKTDTLAVSGVLPELPDPCCVSMGNPHAVFFVDDVERFDVAKFGSQVETHPLFPDRTNVEFAEVLAKDLIRMRVWERGAGITEACGTGACATLVAAVRRGLSADKAEIRMDGGSLWIEWKDRKDILMTGKTHCAFTGVYNG